MVKGLSKTKCKVMRMADSLDDGDRRIFLNAVADSETWAAIRLERELKARGLRISNDTILAHRAGICCCGGK